MDHEHELVVLASAVGSLTLLSFLAFCVWLDYRKKRDERQAVHAERLKALEMGLSLPDAAQARSTADRSRARAAGAIGILVPLFTLGAGVGATALVLIFQPFAAVPILTTLWAVCGVALIITVVLSLRSLHGQPVAEPDDRRLTGHGLPSGTAREPVVAEFAPDSAAIKERT